MADIQIISPLPVRSDVAVDVATPAPVTGESGFDVWAVVTGVPTAAATAVPPAPVLDPLAAWLDQQMGFSGQFSAAPGTNPEIEALAAGLPPLPTLELAVGADVPPAGPSEILLSVDPQISEVVMVDNTADAAPPVAGAAVVTKQPDVLGAPTLVAQPAPPVTAAPSLQPSAAAAPSPQPSVAAAPYAQPSAAPIAALPATDVVPAALAPVGVPISVPSRPGRQAAAVEGAPARPQPDVPVDVAPLPADQAAADRPTPAMARDRATYARSEITLPASLTEMLAEVPFGTDPQLPAASRTAAATAATSASWQPAAHEPRAVLQQVAEAVVSSRGDRTEIALSPEELGRIRLVMSGPDRGQITIWAERPETLDLIRRNSDLLTQQLADAGVTAGNLDFRRDDRSGGQAAQSGPTDDDDVPVMATTTRVRMSPASLSDRRLDIRL